MGSASRRFLPLALLIAAAAPVLSGCVTTQQKNARTVLLNQRTLASQSSVRVTIGNPSVRILGEQIVRGAGEVALAVQLLNHSSRPLTDLPISVGLVTRGGGRMYLNGAANTGYYDAHVPGIEARGQTAWIYVARSLPAAGKAFAVVGVPRLPPSTTVRPLPRIEATVTAAATGTLRATVSNLSGVPQYGLQVYAVAVRGGRAVGAAHGSVAELDGGSRTRIELRLLGTATGAQLHVYTVPTIFA